MLAFISQPVPLTYLQPVLIPSKVTISLFTKINIYVRSSITHKFIKLQIDKNQGKGALITEGRIQSQQCESPSIAHHDEPGVPTGQHSDQCQAVSHSSALM